ncbi:hypothetical protein FB45DRAFT_36523 [Roridomyces roridus]|uniref:HNH nuclease domain-containing protein n=1 Tax=Roridomyces roridus TaxID=1738132 RepID=A0AAD7FJL5_9AGAR|nr:hypothetical protein FB45DRAFT_36523 [Roridomyces roridus]
MATSVPPAHVRLILTPLDDSFHLDVPADQIHHICKKPLKYLRFWGVIIMSVLGSVNHSRDPDDAVDYEAALIDCGTYYYVYEGADGIPAPAAVNPEILRDFESSCTSSISTLLSCRLKEFEKQVKLRDKRCIFSGAKFVCNAGHIIDFHVDARFKDEIRVNAVNAIQNGLTMNPNIHKLWSMNLLAVIKTPNAVLSMEDILQRARPLVQCRFTLQTITDTIPQAEVTGLLGGYNVDAAFPIDTPHDHRPSALLLHYLYAVRTVHHWGKGQAFLSAEQRPDVPRPAPREATGRTQRRRAERRAADGDGPNVAEQLVLSHTTPSSGS